MGINVEPLRILRNFSRNRWRSWLTRNHSSEKGAWLVLYKKHTGKSELSHSDALDEALCFGWIDGKIKTIDDETYMVWFSPRRKESVWSNLNVMRVRNLIARRRMTSAGLAKIDKRTLGRHTTRKGRPTFRMSSEMKKRLMKHKKAWKNYCNLPPSSRGMYAHWLSVAKHPETKTKRLKEAVALLEKNKKLGMK